MERSLTGLWGKKKDQFQATDSGRKMRKWTQGERTGARFSSKRLLSKIADLRLGLKGLRQTFGERPLLEYDASLNCAFATATHIVKNIDPLWKSCDFHLQIQ